MTETSNASEVYRRFLDWKLGLQEAAALLSGYSRSGTTPAGTLAFDTLALEALSEDERQRVGQLLNEVMAPVYRAFATGEIDVETAARQLAPSIPPHSFFALDETAQDGSPWSPEAVARFSELFQRLAEMSRESGTQPC